VQFDLDQQRWIWLFQSEAKKLKFATPYNKIPKQRRPIVLGSFHFHQDDVMWLDVRSHQRATKAIVFFDRRIPRSAAQVTHAAIVNRLFGVTTATLPPLDALFDEAKIIEKNAEDILQAATQFGTIPDVRERIDKVFAFMDQKSREPLPDVEKFPVHFYEDGIQSFETALRMRQIVALEHWQGNREFTFGDMMKKIIPGL
jgi:hypothetical protein